MVALANLTRRGFADGDLSTVMSPRTVVTWAQNATLFHDVGARLQAHVPQPLRRGRAGARRRVLPALHGRRPGVTTRPGAGQAVIVGHARAVPRHDRRSRRRLHARRSRSSPMPTRRSPRPRPRRLSGLRAFADRMALGAASTTPHAHGDHRPADADARRALRRARARPARRPRRALARGRGAEPAGASRRGRRRRPLAGVRGDQRHARAAGKARLLAARGQSGLPAALAARLSDARPPSRRPAGLRRRRRGLGRRGATARAGRAGVTPTGRPSVPLPHARSCDCASSQAR